MTRLLPALLLMMTTACVEDLEPDGADDPGPATEGSEGTDDGSDDAQADGDLSLDGPDADGDTWVDVNATDATRWVHLDLASAEQTDEAGAWTLAFQRYRINLNGGVSGDGMVEATFVPDLAYDDALQAPVDGWITDAADADEDGEPERAFDDWYDYDPATHVLTPKPGTWFVRDGEQAWAVEILDYYSEAGDSGYPSLRYRGVTGP